jgi:hypothetical protein
MENRTGVMFAALPSELKLILLCARLQLTEEEKETGVGLLEGKIDWALVLHLAAHHRLYPLIYRNLCALGHTAVPGDVLAGLRQLCRDNAAKTLKMTAELVRLVQVMDENGLRPVVLKGAPLAAMVYGDGALRPSRDLDILVWPNEVEQAAELIKGLGYRPFQPNVEMTPPLLRQWMRTSHHCGYWHEGREICIELHWRLGHPGMDIPLADLEQGLTSVLLAGRPLRVLGPDEQLLFLILHGANHAWFRLRWLVDIAMVLRQGGFSWDGLYRLARRLDAESAVNQAVILCRELLWAPVPDAIIRLALADKKAQKSARLALPIIAAADYEPERLTMRNHLYYRRKRYELSIYSGWRGKVTYLHGLFSPSEHDVKLVTLPQYLYSLYYLLRPFTWLYRRARPSAEN